MWLNPVVGGCIDMHAIGKQHFVVEFVAVVAAAMPLAVFVGSFGYLPLPK